MKATLTIISILFLFGCRTKITSKEKEKTDEKIEIQIDRKYEVHENVTNQKTETKKDEIQEKKKESSTDIEIKGKAESGKPLEIYDIQNGDTIQSLTVIGNASINFKSKRSNSDNSKKEISESETQNIIEKISREVVKEKNLVKAGKTIKKSAKDLKVKDMSTGTYITAIVLGSSAIIMFFIFLYFKRNKQ